MARLTGKNKASPLKRDANRGMFSASVASLEAKQGFVTSLEAELGSVTLGFW
jgi:hypothetical protein